MRSIAPSWSESQTELAVLRLKSLNTLVFLVVSASAANATTAYFGTGTTSGFASGGTTSVTAINAAGVTGLTIIVTAGTTTFCDLTCIITSTGAGYGVNNSTGGTATDSSPTIDGNGLIDTLTLSFNQIVTLTGISFGEWDNNDDVGIYNGATLVTTYSANGGSVVLNTTGTTFQLRATGSNDDYRLQSIDFTATASTATPEPTTFALMGFALLGVGFFARRRTNRR
jgi:hypothetical protein